MSHDILIPGLETSITYANLQTESTHLEVRCGNIYTEAKGIFNYFQQWKNDHNYQVVVVMEQPFNKRFVAVYAALRCVQIAVACAAHQYEFPIRYVTPNQSRAALDLPAGADKADIRMKILKRYSSTDSSLESADDNITDAIAIADAFAAGYCTNKSIRRIR